MLGEVIAEKMADCVLDGTLAGFGERQKWKQVFREAAQGMRAQLGEYHELYQTMYSEQAMDALLAAFMDAPQGQKKCVLRQYSIKPLREMGVNAAVCDVQADTFYQMVLEGMADRFPHQYSSLKQQDAQEASMEMMGQLQHMMQNGNEEIAKRLHDMEELLEHASVQKKEMQEPETASFAAGTISVNDIGVTWELHDIHLQGEIEAGEKLMQILQVWQEERNAYPGWYVTPFAIAKTLSCKTEAAYGVHLLDGVETEAALRYLEQYMWRCDRSMMSMSNVQLDEVYAYWLRCLEHEKEKLVGAGLSCWLRIGWYMLQEYREGHAYTKWNLIHTACTNLLSAVLDETERQSLQVCFWYEKLQLQFSRGCFGRVEQEIKRYQVAEECYPIRHGVIYMLLQLGEYTQAMERLEQLIADVERKLLDKENGQQEVIQAASMLVVLYHLYVSQKRAMRIGREQSDEEGEAYKRASRRYQELSVYFEYEEQIQQAMQSYLPYSVKWMKRNTPTFAVNRETVYLAETGISGAECGYYLYRFLQRCGMPRQSHHMYFVNREYELVMNQYLLACNPVLAVESMLIGAHVEQIRTLVTHKLLWKLGTETVTSLIEYVLDVFSQNMDAFGYHIGWEQQDIYGLILENGMELLARLVTYCPKTMARRTMLVAARLAQENLAGHSLAMDQFLYQINQYVPEDVKASVLPEVAATGLRTRQMHAGRQEPVDCMDGLCRKEAALGLFQRETVAPQVIDNLLEIAEHVREQRRVAINRLMILYRFGQLQETQSKRFASLLWSERDAETGLPDLPDLYCYQYLEYPCIPYVDVQGLIERYFLQYDWIGELDDASGIRMTYGTIRYFSELRLYLQYMQERKRPAFSEEQRSRILKTIRGYWKMDVVQARMQDDEGRDSVRAEYRKRKETMQECALLLGEQIETFDGMRSPYAEDFAPEQVVLTMQRLSQKILYQNPTQEELQYVIKTLCQLAVMPEEGVAVSALITLHNFIYREIAPVPAQAWEEMNAMLLYLNRTVVYTEALSEQAFKAAIHRRKCAAGLAFIVNTYYDKRKWTGLLAVRTWRDTCMDGTEFAEVRNEWVEEDEL